MIHDCEVEGSGGGVEGVGGEIEIDAGATGEGGGEVTGSPLVPTRIIRLSIIRVLRSAVEVRPRAGFTRLAVRRNSGPEGYPDAVAGADPEG